MRSRLSILPKKKLAKGFWCRYGRLATWMKHSKSLQVKLSVGGSSFFEGLVYITGVTFVRFPRISDFVSPINLSSVGLCYKATNNNVVTLYGFSYHNTDLQLVELGSAMHSDKVLLSVDWSGEMLKFYYMNEASKVEKIREVEFPMVSTEPKWYIRPFRAFPENKLVIMDFYSNI